MAINNDSLPMWLLFLKSSKINDEVPIEAPIEHPVELPPFLELEDQQIEPNPVPLWPDDIINIIKRANHEFNCTICEAVLFKREDVIGIDCINNIIVDRDSVNHLKIGNDYYCPDCGNMISRSPTTDSNVNPLFKRTALQFRDSNDIMSKPTPFSGVDICSDLDDCEDLDPYDPRKSDVESDYDSDDPTTYDYDTDDYSMDTDTDEDNTDTDSRSNEDNTDTDSHSNEDNTDEPIM